MSRRTPAARALVGCLALRSGATINDSFRLAGYELRNPGEGTSRLVVRGGRVVASTRNAGAAVAWLYRLGDRLERRFAAADEEQAIRETREAAMDRCYLPEDGPDWDDAGQPGEALP